MFEDSLVESAALLRTHNRWPALFSIATQSAVAVLILSLPLLHPELIPMPHAIPATLVPPHLPVAVLPVALPRTLSRSSAIAIPAAVATVGTTTECVCDHPDTNRAALAGPALGAVNIAGNAASLPPGIGSVAPAGPHVTLGPAATSSSKTPAVSSGVSAGHLIGPIRPEYPAIARTAGVGGTVVIAAIISRTGAIESAQVVSGPPMLQRAALDAVRQARYRPFLLNGQPTDVQTTITIIFRLGS